MYYLGSSSASDRPNDSLPGGHSKHAKRETRSAPLVLLGCWAQPQLAWTRAPWQGPSLRTREKGEVTLRLCTAATNQTPLACTPRGPQAEAEEPAGPAAGRKVA